MENTILNFKKFASLYYGQKVFKCKERNGLLLVNEQSLLEATQTDYLQLKSLQSISDEDVQNLPTEYNNAEDFKNMLEETNGYLNQEESDKLRELGYLIGYNSLTPDQIIEYGWAKI